MIKKTITPTPIRKAPTVLTRFNRSKPWFGRYVNTRRCIPRSPRKCCTKKVKWKPMINVQNSSLPSFSFNTRPNIFGHQ
ncbi:hypothetical protein D1872_274760 [compost metagenome]